MTIRPFKITYNTSKKQGLRCSILTHRGEYLLKEKKLGKKFFDKLLSYPITAFGYDIFQIQSMTWAKALGDVNLNPKFDRHDVIKALDFWIEHWVYQNKRDYILQGTVDKDFELTVRELIETREAVLKLPADTQFVRQKIRPDAGSSFEREYNLTYTDGKKYEPDPNKIIEFTENVLTGGNSSASTVDQFCYVVRKMTYKEYMDQKNKPYATGTIRYNFSNDNFRDDGARFDFGDVSIISKTFNDLSRTLSKIGAGTSADDDTVPKRQRRGLEFDALLPSQRTEGPDHLLHSNLHPGIPSSTETEINDTTWIGPGIFTMPDESPSSTGFINPESALASKRISRIDIRLRKQGELNLRPSSTKTQRIIQLGRLLGLNEQQIRDSVGLTTKSEEDD